MQTDIADVGTLRKQITITYSAEEFQARQDELLNKYAQRVSLKGFRPGKTPRTVVRKRYGEAVQAEATEQLLNESIKQALDEHELIPIGNFSDEKPNTEDGLRYTTSFDIRPAIELPDPVSISIVADDTTASDAEIDDELNNLLKRVGTQVDLTDDETLITDDTITLCGKITADETLVREVNDLNHCLGAYPLFGKDPADIVAMASTCSVGSALEFDTTLPETFRPEEWAGKEAHISVTVQQAQRQQPATLDPDLFKRFGVDDEAALRERVREQIRNQKDQAQHQAQLEQLTDQLITHCSFELPPATLDQMVENHLEQAIERARRENDEVDEAAIRAEQEAEARERAERFLRRNLILSTIAETYEIDASREDLQQQIMMAAYQSGQKPQEIVSYLQKSGQIHQVTAEIRESKALEFFLEQVLNPSEQPAEA